MEHQPLQRFFQRALTDNHQHHIVIHFEATKGDFQTRKISLPANSNKRIGDISSVYHQSDEVRQLVSDIGREIRRTIKEIKGEGALKVWSVAIQLRSSQPLEQQGEALPDGSEDDLDQSYIDYIADMTDDEFDNHLEEVTKDLVVSSEEQPHKLSPEVSKKLGKSLAADFKKSGLKPWIKTDRDVISENLIVKLAVRLVTLAICENARAERRAEAKREEKEQIENQELKRDILKSEILKYDISRQEMEGAIIEALLENWDEEQKASEEDLKAVAKALVDLVWFGLPKAFIAGF